MVCINAFFTGGLHFCWFMPYTEYWDKHCKHLIYIYWQTNPIANNALIMLYNYILQAMPMFGQWIVLSCSLSTCSERLHWKDNNFLLTTCFCCVNKGCVLSRGGGFNLFNSLLMCMSLRSYYLFKVRGFELNARVMDAPNFCCTTIVKKDFDRDVTMIIVWRWAAPCERKMLSDNKSFIFKCVFICC